MKRLTLLAARVILLSRVVRPAIADQQGSLRWAGCGFSKKAYMVALAEAYEKKSGTKIDLEESRQAGQESGLR